MSPLVTINLFLCQSASALDIDTYTPESSPSVFPNPANHTITVVMDHYMEIIDITGHRVSYLNANGTHRVNVSHLPKGFYTVRIDGNKTTKLVINR